MNKSGIKELHEHCANVAYALGILENYRDHISLNRHDVERIYNWLWLAGSIVNVEVDFIRHDINFGYCKDADYYQLNTETLQRRFATQLTTFNFAWVSLEGLISAIISKSQLKKYGKINAACFLLKQQLERTPAIPHYKEYLLDLLQNIVNHPYYKNDINFDIEISGKSGLGIRSVYGIRNSFAHGALRLPQLNEDDDFLANPEIDIRIIEVSTRIVLLTMQALLMAQLKDHQFDVYYWWCPFEMVELLGKEKDVDVHKVLSLMHCELEHWINEPVETIYSDIVIDCLNTVNQRNEV